MGLFDSLKRQAVNEIKKEGTKAVTGAATKAANAATGKVKAETYTFAALPTSVAELQALPECSLDSPFKSVALAIAALCNYEKNPESVHEMLDFLNGPNEVSPYQKQFLKDRLTGKYYKPFSFFAGATPQNGYTPTQPYTITVRSNPYSFPEENYAKLFVKSSGGDSEREVICRKKPSTGQWFVTDIQCLADIRIPVEEDPWA